MIMHSFPDFSKTGNVFFFIGGLFVHYISTMVMHSFLQKEKIQLKKKFTHISGSSPELPGTARNCADLRAFFQKDAENWRI